MTSAVQVQLLEIQFLFKGYILIVSYTQEKKLSFNSLAAIFKTSRELIQIM
jgi:hypothetical protein